MTIAHVRYREGQILRAADLRAEQQDRLEGWRRHVVSVHGWGIAHGLGLTVGLNGATVDPDCRRGSIALVVSPGLAIDRWGRALVLRAEQAFRFEQLCRAAAPEPWCIGVWLWPTSASVDCPTRGPSGEKHEACIVLAAPPPGAGSSACLARSLDDSWLDPPPIGPVYLGSVQHWDDCCRIEPDVKVPYVSLAGSTVRAPSGAIEMQLGRERLDDFTRFAIRTFHEPDAPETAGDTGETATPRVPVDRIRINAAGRITLRGPVEIVPSEQGDATSGPVANTSRVADRYCDLCISLEDGVGSAAQVTNSVTANITFATANLIVESACAKRPRGVRFAPPLPVPEQPRPWQLYHAKEQGGGRFRIELPDLGGENNPDAIQLVIGHSGDCAAPPCDECGDERAATQVASRSHVAQSSAGASTAADCCFTECLAVTADCGLRIPKCSCLVVHGRIMQAPIQPDPNDPRFTAAQMAAVLQALLNAFLLTVPSPNAAST